MSRLAGQVRSGRNGLKAKTPQKQAAAAAGLASAYSGAAKALGAKSVSPIDQEANAQLIAALKRTGAAYKRAAAAARHKSTSGFHHQSAGVVAGERAVAGALAGLKAIGYKLPAATRVPGTVSALPALAKVKKQQQQTSTGTTGTTGTGTTGQGTTGQGTTNNNGTTNNGTTNSGTTNSGTTSGTTSGGTSSGGSSSGGGTTSSGTVSGGGTT
jgi:hypothetical protein